MKTIAKLLAICGLMATVSGAAQAQYNIGWNSMDANNAFVLQGNSGGTYMQVTRDAALSFNLSKLPASATSVVFGVSALDANNNLLYDLTFADLNAGDVFSQNFSAGDQIAFWLEVDGKKISTMGWEDYFGTLKGANEFDLNFHVDDMSWKDWWDTQMRIISGPPAPAGQPLPGVVATLVAGSLVLLVPLWKRQRGSRH